MNSQDFVSGKSSVDFEVVTDENTIPYTGADEELSIPGTSLTLATSNHQQKVDNEFIYKINGKNQKMTIKNLQISSLVAEINLPCNTDCEMEDTKTNVAGGITVAAMEVDNALHKHEEIKEDTHVIVEEKVMRYLLCSKLRQYYAGCPVIGKFERYGFWFGKIVNQKKDLPKGHVWVQWFGDNKILHFRKTMLFGCSEFSSVFSKKKVKSTHLYKKAVFDFLKQVYEMMHGMEIKHSINKRTKRKFSQFDWLVEWGLNEFPVKVYTEKDDGKKEAPPNLPITNVDFEFVNNDKTYEGRTKKKPTAQQPPQNNNAFEEKHSCEKISREAVVAKQNITSIVDEESSNDLSKNKMQATLPDYIGAEKKLISKKRKSSLEKLFTHNELFLSNIPEKRSSFKKAVDLFSFVNKPKLCDVSSNMLDAEKHLKMHGTSLSSSNEILQDQAMEKPTASNGFQSLKVESLSPRLTSERSQCSKPWRYKDDSGIDQCLIGDESDLSTCSSSANNADVSSEVSSSSSIVESRMPKTDRLHGGIRLNHSLLFKDAPKRKCFFDASQKFDGKKRKFNKEYNSTIERFFDVDRNCNVLGTTEQQQTSKGATTYRNKGFCLPETSREKYELSEREAVACTKTLDMNKKLNDIKVGDLVLAKMRGYDWWFAKVIHHKQVRQSPPDEGCFWIYWYGDHKKSVMKKEQLELLATFKQRYLPHKMKGDYRKAVEEILHEIIQRYPKDRLPSDIRLQKSDECFNNSQLQARVKWAINGFQPIGISGFASKYQEQQEDTVVQASLDSEQTVLPRISKQPMKDRYGRIIVDPHLSEDVKKLFDCVADGKMDVEEICLACGDTNIATQHPLFYGGLCQECKEHFIEGAYLYDSDGSQMYCCICSDGDELMLCDQIGCCRSYCAVCLDIMCGVGYAEQIANQEAWYCFMCTGESVRVLQCRGDWQEKMKDIFLEDSETMDFVPAKPFQPIALADRKPIRVLALFDGIGTGYHVLKQLKMDVECYFASEIDENAIKVTLVHHNSIRHVGNVCLITREQVNEWGPFDLVLGGSPCNDLSIANPARKGVYEGTGRLFFEYFRLLEYARPPPDDPRPFFWLFENVVGMRYCDKDVITRFLQCHPVVISAKEVSAQHRTRYFWGNLPGMKRPIYPVAEDRLKLQDCLEKECGRIAKVEKVRCITTTPHSLKQTKKLTLPVELKKAVGEQKDDVLWLTEVERIFGFPEHYTDVANMGQRQRQMLLGKAWSVPVIRHLLSPLANYFKKED